MAEVPPTVGSTWRRALRAVRGNLGPLLAFDVAFRGLSALALAPLVAWVVSLLVRGTGTTAVTNVDLMAFCLSPRGLATVVVGSALVLTLELIESAGMIHILAGRRAGRPRGLKTALKAVALASPRALRLSLALSVRLLGAAIPFLAALGGIYAYFLTEHDINAYLHDKPSEFWVAVSLGGTVFLAGAATLGALWTRWSLALPIALEEGLAARPALAESTRRTRGARRRIALVLLGWLLVAFLVTAALLFAFDRLGAAILLSVPEKTSVVLPLLAVLVALRVILAAGTTFVGASGEAALLLDLHFERGGSVVGGAGEEPAARSESRRTIGAVAILAVVLAGAGIAGTVVVRRARADRVAVAHAHRGASIVAPENTRSAVLKAIEAGAEWAEIDVQRTKDGVIVLGHDADLMRAAGVPLVITASTYEELKAADLGTRFSSAYAGERIATLKEVMDLSRDKILLNIEMKFYGKDRRLVEDLVRLIRDEKYESRCIVASLDVPSVIEAHRLDRSIRTAAIVSMVVGDLPSLDVDVLSVKADLATDAMIRASHARGKEVLVWTVDDAREMSDWIDRGVDGIVTNEPATLARVRKERLDLSDAERLLLVGRSLFR